VITKVEMIGACSPFQQLIAMQSGHQQIRFDFLAADTSALAGAPNGKDKKWLIRQAEKRE